MSGETSEIFLLKGSDIIQSRIWKNKMEMMKITMEEQEIEENVKSLICPRKESSNSKYRRIAQSFEKYFRHSQRTQPKRMK